jgi:hypothetical protein
MKRVLALLIFCLLVQMPTVLACVGCREPGVGNIDEPQTVLAGIALSWGVLCMLTVVFAVVGTMVIYITRTCQRLDSQNKNL